jgi:IS1 family transposase
MANVLKTDKQIQVVAALPEGSAIRSIERMTGIHRDTIMRLGVKVGQGCTALMDEKMRDLPCKRLEMDEIWGFVGKKKSHVKATDAPGTGSVWTFCASDSDTKLVLAEKEIVRGMPDFDLISTSYVERLNATTRHHMRRLTRLTLALSKKFENFEAAVGLHFAYYNFVKRHSTLRCTPAMAAGLTPGFWSVGDLLEAAT